MEMEKYLLKRIEKLRKEMHNLMDEYGFIHAKTVAKSQELDVVLNRYDEYRRGVSKCVRVAN